jgi:hypothetical protein
MQLVAQVTELKRLAARRLKCFAGIAVNPDDLETVINCLTALKPIARLILSSLPGIVVTHLMRRKTHGVLLPRRHDDGNDHAGLRVRRSVSARSW